jgi:putative hemolysin
VISTDLGVAQPPHLAAARRVHARGGSILLGMHVLCGGACLWCVVRRSLMHAHACTARAGVQSNACSCVHIRKGRGPSTGREPRCVRSGTRTGWRRRCVHTPRPRAVGMRPSVSTSCAAAGGRRATRDAARCGETTAHLCGGLRAESWRAQLGSMPRIPAQVLRAGEWWTVATGSRSEKRHPSDRYRHRSRYRWLGAVWRREAAGRSRDESGQHSEFGLRRSNAYIGRAQP